jgi:hypothetical protein
MVGGLWRITDRIHQYRQSKFAAAKPNKPGETTDWHTPTEGLLKISALNCGLHRK